MKISLVVPVFNEEDTIPIFYQSIRRELTQYEVQIVFINDGSTDNSEAIINALAVADQNVMALSFTRNFGKEPALIAGLEHATGEVVIPMDVDLQDPISVIPLMMEKWRAGADMVLAKRIDRQVDSHLKRKTAQWFYRIHNKISSPRIEENVGDFRLMSRKIVEDIKRMPERNLFMKGVLSWVGGNVDIVEYVRAERVAGASKFNGWKLWNLAIEGITSFSTFPLRIWAYIGLTVAAMSFLYGSWLAIITIFFGNPVHGYTSLIVSILFLGGIQLIGIGVLGEYIGRIYIETKQRPRYILKK
ncbi:glycosyltransferase family 2 protein [Erwinia sp. V90_4]|jgi:glycosyltransferase involved in cell wall biosynthesis|uniref:glycosyltransferase family 2 protein n=1 Tax=Erwinia TaxID=551 RepID=UPI00249F2E98|nr:glycosyltransferase family 2 protein [Erwinia sp. V90_4]MDI3439633.1 glycosyltransferase family 2 protein [Erwinia sp. V90_4]